MRTTHRVAAVLGILSCMLVSTFAQDVRQRGFREIRVPGTPAVIRVDSDQASVSRDGGESWLSLTTPETRLMLRCGAFDPLERMPAIPAMLRSDSSNRVYLVQFHTQILAEYRSGLEAAGAEIFHFIPYQTCVARMSAEVAHRVARLPYVRWVGDLHPAYRLEEALVETVLGGRELPPQRYNLVLVDWQNDHRALEDAIIDLGGTIDNVPEGSMLIEATLTGAQLLEAAALNTVLWIDRWTPIESDVDNARIQGGADFLEPKKTLGYTGKGLRGYNTEAIYSTHTEFAATSYRSGPIRHRSTSADSHGTSVNGIIFARGVRADARGLCPDAQCISASSSVVSANRDVVTQEAVDPNLQYKAMFMTASWGNSRTVQYTSVSSQMDDILFKYDIPHTQSQSNAGATSVPRDSRPQAWAKNMISVGGVRHGNNANPADDAWNKSGSIGPAPDGRIKPDIAAYYDSIRTTSGSASYTESFGGTSGATPIVNGHVGLIVEMFTDGIFGHPLRPNSSWQNRFENKPHMTTTKALLLNTARQYPFSGANHDLTRVHVGYGFPSLEDLYTLRNKLLAIDESVVLSNRQSATWFVFVPAGEPLFRVTLDYADPAGLPNSTVNRINNLDLKVTAPDGTSYWGNNGLLVGNYSTPGGAANTIDTVENVFVNNPPSGLWTVTVIAAELNQDSHVETPGVDADFALVVSGIGGGRDRSGTLLDVTSQAPGDITVTVNTLPAGFVQGWVLFSLDTRLAAGFGTFFGIAPDALTFAAAAQPPLAGSPFHFPNHKAASFPNRPYSFPTAVATVLKGVAVDATAVYVDGASRVVGVSNVSRVTVK